MWIVFCLLLIFPVTLLADEITVDTSGWTQRQKNMKAAISYSLMYKSGVNVVPKIQGDIITFDGVDKAYIESVISGQKILDGLIVSDAENAANSAIEEQEKKDKKDALKSKMKLTEDDLKTLKEVLSGIQL